MTLEELEVLVSQGEQLGTEFKSEYSRQISDSEIYEEIIALANTEGGTLLLGVEDDGAITGAQPRHGNTTDPTRLRTAIFNNTVPNVNTRVSIVQHPQGQVITVQVDPYPEICATTGGKSLRRIVGGDGKPATVPYYPRDQRSRRIDLGLIDHSAQPVESADMTALDPLEFERLRQTIRRLRGDQNLLHLSNEELAKALRLVETRDNHLVPNFAGLLLLGTEESIRQWMPTHEVRFQVIDAQGDVKVNDVFSGPALNVLEELERRFNARNTEQEVNLGLFRLPVPDYAPEGFREAVNNAMLHRDFTRLGAVYVQWQPDHLLITNAGGFPEGVTLTNLLVHEPKPRNPRLAEAFRRIGLVEQTGRGIDKIYMGQLRYGRPIPDYSRSDRDGVRVVLYGGKASLGFAAFVYEQDKQGSPLTLDELMVLNKLFLERRIDSENAGVLIQKGPAHARSVLESLQERGLLTAKGEKRGRVYHLSASLYRRLGQSEGYVRTHGIDPIRQEAMVLEYAEAHGSVGSKNVVALCDLTSRQAGYLLKRMCEKGKLTRKGQGRWSSYVIGNQ